MTFGEFLNNDMVWNKELTIVVNDDDFSWGKPK